MDEVFFAAKRVHWTGVRFWRPVLERFGLTPARFDLLHALTDSRVDKTQRALRVALGVARATISEMLGALEKLGLIRRARDTNDGRTRRVTLTVAGRAALERAYEACVGSGVAALAVDACFARWRSDGDPGNARFDFDFVSRAVRTGFGDSALVNFYQWDPDDYIGGLDEAEIYYLVDLVKLRPDAIRSSFRESAR